MHTPPLPHLPSHTPARGGGGGGGECPPLPSLLPCDFSQRPFTTRHSTGGPSTHPLPTHAAQAHAPGAFTGENSFHIYAVNQREDHLCEAIQLAHDNLSPAQLQQLYWSHATGPFFSERPMVLYGETPLSYACCHCLRRAVALMLSLSLRSPKMRHIIDPNNEEHACRRTGFLPLHALVATGRMQMYDFLADLPGIAPLRFMRADENALSQHGTHAQLSPLQLACRLGDHDMFKHIINRRSQVIWKW